MSQAVRLLVFTGTLHVAVLRAAFEDSTSFEDYSISVESSFGSYDSLVDRNTTAGVAAYDYSVNLIWANANNHTHYRAFTGGRWRDPENGIDGDHILQWSSIGGAPDTWEMVRKGPEFLHGNKDGYANTWLASNVMDAEVLLAEDGKWIMMVQVMINRGWPIDLPGMTAKGAGDRIMLLSADRLDGQWERFAERGVVRNISDPTTMKLHHPELIYVPWDEEGLKYWLYFALSSKGRFKGHYQIRSDDYRSFDFAQKKRVGNMVGIGNQIAYIEEAPGGPIFLRITSVGHEGRRVPGLQLSRDGLGWTDPTRLKLEGSSDAGNKNCYFAGISTYLGHGKLEQVGSNRWKAVYAAATSASPTRPAIWSSEIGVGEVIIEIATLVE